MTAGTATTGYKRSKTVPGTRESGTPAAPSPCGATSDTPSVGSESPPRFMPCATRPCPGQHVQKQPRDARGARAAMGAAPRLSCRATMQRPLTPRVAPEKTMQAWSCPDARQKHGLLQRAPSSAPARARRRSWRDDSAPPCRQGRSGSHPSAPCARQRPHVADAAKAADAAGAHASGVKGSSGCNTLIPNDPEDHISTT